MITLDKAKKALVAAEKKAEELGIAVSAVVVDEHGDKIAFSRMDGAIQISPIFAETKARTAGMTGMATSDIAPYAVEGKPYFGIDDLSGGELTTIAGGLPVKLGGKLVGGVGVGGSMDVNQDVQCAQVALKALVD